jgi:hypothetical protein
VIDIRISWQTAEIISNLLAGKDFEGSDELKADLIDGIENEAELIWRMKAEGK